MKMEDTNILLMRVLKIHFKDRLHILDDALTVLKEYSGKETSTQSEYDEISTTLKDMLNSLPQDILKYFLTLVPLPKYTENLALNNHDAEDIRSVLMNYVNREVPSLATATKQVDTNAKVDRVDRKRCSRASTPSGSTSASGTGATTPVKKRIVKRRPGRGTKCQRDPQECKKLIDICAEYIVKNHAAMTQDYQSKNDEVWRLLNGTKKISEGESTKLYELGQDLNKKLRWLRLLEAEEMTDEIIRDSYYDEEVFIRESELRPLLKEDPFAIEEELQKSIWNFVSS